MFALEIHRLINVLTRDREKLNDPLTARTFKRSYKGKRGFVVNEKIPLPKKHRRHLFY